jgi:hypothetical protein
MNQIARFRRCTLSDMELLRKVDEITDNIYKTGQIPTRHIPAEPNNDYDLLVGELILRMREQIEGVSTELQNVQASVAREAK